MDWESIITLAVAIVSTVSAMILGVMAIRKKKPVWSHSTRHIIGRDAEAPPELKYVFGDKEVTEVYKTTIIFFNMGNDKFYGDKVPASNMR